MSTNYYFKLKEKPKDNVDKVEEQPKDNIEIKDKTEENVLISNPATGDNIIKYIIAFITSIVGIVICKCKKIRLKLIQSYNYLYFFISILYRYRLEMIQAAAIILKSFSKIFHKCLIAFINLQVLNLHLLN